MGGQIQPDCYEDECRAVILQTLGFNTRLEYLKATMVKEAFTMQPLYTMVIQIISDKIFK